MVHCCQTHFDMGEIHEKRLLVLTGVLKKVRCFSECDLNPFGSFCHPHTLRYSLI